MNSRVLVLVVVAAAVYLIFVLAHERFDREPGSLAVARADDDLSDLLAPLLSEGRAAIDELRRELAERDPEMLALVPGPDEPWQARLGALLADPPRPPYGRVELAVVEPSGLQIGTRPALLLRRELPGRAWVELSRANETEPLAGFAASVNTILGLPEELELEPGAAYRVRARNESGDADFVEAEFRIATAAEVARFQEAMQFLKLKVADTRLRIYLQACFAMSRGLYTDATEILMKRLPRNGQGREERGLLERLAFLLERRGELVARDRALEALARD